MTLMMPHEREARRTTRRSAVHASSSTAGEVGHVDDPGVDTAAQEHGLPWAAAALTRLATEVARVAEESQALAAEAAEAACATTRQQSADEVAQHVAEHAQHLAEARQHLAEEAQRAAEEALHLRTDALGAVAHDLRIPLTSLIGRTALVRERLDRAADLNAERAWLTAQLDKARVAALHLQTIIEEINDAARLVSGEALELDDGPLDVGALAHGIAEEFALQRSITVVAPDTPVLIVGDRARLARVLQNLVGNAVKYCAPGTPIRITVTARATAAVIGVQDRGVGIPAAELPRLFERYYRAATARGISGTGLGLAGSQAIIAQHGGTIAVESTEGVGTTVTVTLPRASLSGG